jgi:hypothetical protein
MINFRPIVIFHEDQLKFFHFFLTLKMEENETMNDHSSFVMEENISFINNVSPVVVSNDDTLTVSFQKKISGKPKSIVWGRYIKQGREISKGHWNATCNFCGEYWYKGSPATLENHLGNLCVKVPVEVRDLFLERLVSHSFFFDQTTKININLI